ncbi:MAG TPA: DUF4388 domain-containing protein [Ktedonosporobacter sp.]|nr:DUF4388 domain-containing protein [Ktedonosporobacter sp.]
MPEQDYAVTEQLSQVIDAIQLGHKTGVLNAERSDGASLQQGMIIFVNGQPVRAHVKDLNTKESLEQLATWRACRFAFLPYLPPDLVGISGATTTGQLSPTPNSEDRRESYIARSTSQPSPWMVVPYRIRQVDESLYWMEHQGFARIYRRLLLLIDGSRTIKDLATLMGRNPDEVYELLSQLAKAGLIHI